MINARARLFMLFAVFLVVLSAVPAAAQTPAPRPITFAEAEIALQTFPQAGYHDTARNVIFLCLDAEGDPSPLLTGGVIAVDETDGNWFIDAENIYGTLAFAQRGVGNDFVDIAIPGSDTTQQVETRSIGNLVESRFGLHAGLDGSLLLEYRNPRGDVNEVVPLGCSLLPTNVIPAALPGDPPLAITDIPGVLISGADIPPGLAGYLDCAPDDDLLIPELYDLSLEELYYLSLYYYAVDTASANLRQRPNGTVLRALPFNTLVAAFALSEDWAAIILPPDMDGDGVPDFPQLGGDGMSSYLACAILFARVSALLSTPELAAALGNNDGDFSLFDIDGDGNADIAFISLTVLRSILPGPLPLPPIRVPVLASAPQPAGTSEPPNQPPQPASTPEPAPPAGGAR
jgi:hypothetical protein